MDLFFTSAGNTKQKALFKNTLKEKVAVKNNNHQQRMKEMGAYVLPPKDSEERIMFEKLLKIQMEQSPEFGKYAKNKFEQAKGFLNIQHNNGANFQMDDLLRNFLNEFNNRNFKHGLNSMPSSFNVMEAFYHYNPEYAFFKLSEERDHLMSFLEFFDFVTSSQVEFNKEVIMNMIDDGIIYSYNGINKVEEITFSTKNGKYYAIGGVSFIKHENEISMLLLCGEKNDIAKETVNIVNDFEIGQVIHDREGILPVGNLEAVPLLGNNNFWQTLVLTRIDLNDMTFGVRYHLQDIGNSYSIITDDVSAFINNDGSFIKPEFEQIVVELTERINLYSVVFEICKTLLYLPLYYDTYGDLVVEERHETKLVEKNNDELRKANHLLKPKDKVKFRNVTLLRRHINIQPNTTVFYTPDIKIDKTGFWKKLQSQQVGNDKHGRPIHGRTWVEKTLTWFETTDDHQTITINTPLKNNVSNNNSNSGIIYVMRSAAHDKNIFKIGLTTRNAEIRADELSRTTGAPDKYLVVQEWQVSDCRLAEKLVHDRLSQFRINPNREFFKVEYKQIINVIENVITQLEEGI